MTRKSQNFELTNNADSNDDRAYVSALPHGKDRYTPQQLALAANNQSDLVDKRVIPNLEIQKEAHHNGVRADWAAARVEARRESEANISAGKPIHHIRYGDTLWDIASASFKKNNGQQPSNGEIMGEVNRLAKKNNIANPNNIGIGTAIDTSPDKGQRQELQKTQTTPNYYDFNGRPRQNDPAPFPNSSRNYYEFNGGPRRPEGGAQLNRTPNYYDFNGRPRSSDLNGSSVTPNWNGSSRNPDYGYSRTPDLSGYPRTPDLSGRPLSANLRMPDLTQRQPSNDVPLTPQTTRDLLQGANPDRSYGPRNINPGMEITPQAKNTSAWRNGHNENLAKVRRGAPTVAFYGDSITHGLQLNPNFKSFAGGSENFGVDSDRTENLLYRLRDGEANFPGGKQPDTAVLLIGTNNIGSQSTDKIAAGILANVKEMSNRMPGTEIVVMGILPRGSANDSARAQVKAVNDLVQQQLQSVPGVKFVDVGPQLTDSRGNLRPGIFQRDNLHPTYNAGYSAILSALQPYVRSRR